jgi:hypothetical protein
MNCRTHITVAILVGGLAGASPARANFPDPNWSVAWWGLPGGQSATLLIVPDGSGQALTEARSAEGQAVDATIHLLLLDEFEQPVAGFAASDMWLESGSSTLSACPGGTVADQGTDAQGRTYWRRPLRAGGSSTGNCIVVVNGSVLGGPGVPLHFRSPDISGDRTIDLTDIGLFASDYFGGYQPRSDLAADGTVDLSDIGVLASGVGVDCP